MSKTSKNIEPDEALLLRESWIKWINHFGVGRFYDSFLRTAQDAESRCIHCGQKIYLDIVEGGGVPDWKTQDGDYGCDESPDTCSEGTGSHTPKSLK